MEVQKSWFHILPELHHKMAPFLFLHFSKKKITEIYFWIQVLQFYTPAARQGGGRGPTARQVDGRDLYVNKNKIFLCRGPWREPAAPLPGGRPPAANWWGGRGAAGSLQGPLRKINLFLLTYRSLPPPYRAVGV